MSVLDFKEIPEAHKATGEQDKFELFARDFFAHLGYKIIREPGRGADGGADILIEEERKGISGNTSVRWLVSCKHKAHSGASVSKTDENEIRDSVESNVCQGFIGFYSTIPSSGLISKVEGIDAIEHQFFDSSKIEQMLLASPKGLEIAERYFPESFSSWSKENPNPAQIFAEHSRLFCKNCSEDITEGQRGIVVEWSKFKEREDGTHYRHVKEIYWCCRGKRGCDHILVDQRRGDGYNDEWEDIFDLRIPTMYIRRVMASLNQIYGEYEYTPEAFEASKELLITLFPYVARNLTQKEVQRVMDLGIIPSYLGGLGY